MKEESVPEEYVVVKWVSNPEVRVRIKTQMYHLCLLYIGRKTLVDNTSVYFCSRVCNSVILFVCFSPSAYVSVYNLDRSYPKNWT